MSKISKFPLLMNERILLRQLCSEDKNEILELRSDAEVNKYLERAPCKTIEDAQSFITTINEHIIQNKALYWAITLQSTKKVAGTICLFDFCHIKNTCEIGYELLLKHQGKGIMKEAIQLVIDYALCTLKINKIFAASHDQNQKSTRLLEHFGFVKYKTNHTKNIDLEIFELENSVSIK